MEALEKIGIEGYRHLFGQAAEIHQRALERRSLYCSVAGENRLVAKLLEGQGSIQNEFERLEKLVVEKSEGAKDLYADFAGLCRALRLSFPASYEACEEEIRLRKRAELGKSARLPLMFGPLGAAVGFVGGVVGGFIIEGVTGLPLGHTVGIGQWFLSWMGISGCGGLGIGAGIMQGTLKARKKYRKLPLTDYREPLFAVQKDIEKNVLFVNDALTRNKSLKDFKDLLSWGMISLEEAMYYTMLLYDRAGQLPLPTQSSQLSAASIPASLEEKKALAHDLFAHLQAIMQDIEQDAPGFHRELERVALEQKALPPS